MNWGEIGGDIGDQKDLQEALGEIRSSIENLTINVKDFGATGDGSTDDTAAIQAALAHVKPNTGWVSASANTGARRVYFPRGTYIISEPISFCSAQIIYGDGRGSKIKAHAGFKGKALFMGSKIDNMYISGVEIGYLTFIATGNIAAISYDETELILVNSKIHDIYLDIGHGLIFDNYTQHCQIERIYSYGPVDRLLYLKGNNNFVYQLDKEGGTGSSKDAYVTIEAHGVGTAPQSSGNVLRNILLEGVGHANKVPFALIGASATTVDGYWMECTVTNGYYLHIENSASVKLSGPHRHGTTRYGKLSLKNSTVEIDTLGTDAEDTSWTNFLTIDSASYLRIKTLYSRRGFNRGTLGMPNVQIDAYEDRLIWSNGTSGWIAEGRGTPIMGRNLLLNPSFEMGAFGWSFNGSNIGTDEYIISELGPGLMRHWVASGASSAYMYQSLTISAAQVGIPVTLRALVKVARDTGAPLAIPWASGAGVASSTDYVRVSASAGWSVIMATVVPREAGTLQVGVRWVGAQSGDELYIDDCAVFFGSDGAINPNTVNDITIAGKSITVAGSAPATGAWKAGDIVYSNNYPATYGWICTASGTPGTWAAMADPAKPGKEPLLGKNSDRELVPAESLTNVVYLGVDSTGVFATTATALSYNFTAGDLQAGDVLQIDFVCESTGADTEIENFAFSIAVAGGSVLAGAEHTMPMQRILAGQVRIAIGASGWAARCDSLVSPDVSLTNGTDVLTCAWTLNADISASTDRVYLRRMKVLVLR